MLELQRWLFKLENPHYEFKRSHWDVFDPDTDRKVGEIRGKQLTWKESLRYWRAFPLEGRTVPDNSLVFSFRPAFRFWRSRLQTFNASGELVGYFQPKIVSVNRGFWVYDGQDRVLGEVRGNWSQYEFQLLSPEGQELGRVSRKLVGMSRSLLYNERDYAITVSDQAKERAEIKLLLWSTAMAVRTIP